MTEKPKRKQCAKCPWKKGVDPHDIPNGYDEEKHCALKSTIAEPASFQNVGEMRMMACHETGVGEEKFCVGWFDNQIGPGNNIGLRLACMSGSIDYHVETDGEQHECLEDTLP